METLKQCRKKIDVIDKKIIALLAERMTLSKHIGEHKKRNNRPVKDPLREKAKMTQMGTDAKFRGLPVQFVKKIYKAIFNQSRKIQGE